MRVSEAAWEAELLARLGGPPRRAEAPRAAGAMSSIGAARALVPQGAAGALAPRGDAVLLRPQRDAVGVKSLPGFADRLPPGRRKGDVTWLPPRRVIRDWTIRPLPVQPVTPVPAVAAPVAAGDYQLWAMPETGTAFFALAQPRLEAFGATLRIEQQGGTLALTGGDLSLALSAYPATTAEEAEALRAGWAAALAAAGHGQRAWTWLPPALQGLSAALDMPGAWLAAPVAASVAADLGEASLRVPLSAFGAQAVRSALEARRGDTLPGSCTLSATVLARHGASLTTRRQDLIAPLGALLGGAGPEHLRIVNPQVSIEAAVLVRGHSLLDSAVVNWTPSEGHAPEALTFGPEGGEFRGTIASDEVRRVRIAWDALIRFRPLGWPVVRARGTLSVAENDWNVSINPESWIAAYSVVVLPLDATGRVVPPDRPLDPGDSLTCELRYAAPFLEGGGSLTTAFQTRNDAVQAAFPMPPGEPPGEVRLTVLAVRGGRDAMKARVLRPEETLVVVRILADARIEIRTNQDPAEESSDVGRALGALAALAGRAGG